VGSKAVRSGALLAICAIRIRYIASAALLPYNGIRTSAAACAQRKKIGWCPDKLGHQPYDECLNEVSSIVQSNAFLTSPNVNFPRNCHADYRHSTSDLPVPG
jgi:hypothetical protein